MPRITDLENKQLANDNFGYSAVGLDRLGASEYTLVSIVCDRSGSVSAFKVELEKCLGEIAKSCKYSPRADNLMVRLTTFNQLLDEVHGFKLLSDVSPDDYDASIHPSGTTALYDAASNAIRAVADFGRDLTKQDFDVNAIVVVVTDGDDNSSTCGPQTVKQALADAVKTEALESLVSILVAVNSSDAHMKDRLDEFHQKAGFTQFVAIDQANSKTLAKLAEFVSKSISAQSQALGTGGPSKSLTF